MSTALEPVTERTPYPHLFSPIQVGTMKLRSRVMLPPHASAIGNIYGTDEEARRNIAYFEQRADAGVAWVASLSTHLANTIIPGFEPTGVGASTTGFFRLPYFVERIQAFSDALHQRGTAVSVQIVHQGGMPHGASARLSAPTINLGCTPDCTRRSPSSAGSFGTPHAHRNRRASGGTWTGSVHGWPLSASTSSSAAAPLPTTSAVRGRAWWPSQPAPDALPSPHGRHHRLELT